MNGEQPVQRQDLHDLAYKRRGVGHWLSAYGDNHAWRWTAADHYNYLRDTANELLQLGEISLDTRNRLVQEAFRCYLVHDQISERAQQGYEHHYEYLVCEGDRVLAELVCTGHLFEPDTRALLGCVKCHDGPEAEFSITRYVDFREVLVGLVRGLTIERPDGPLWHLVPTQLCAAPKRWAACPGF